MTAWPQEFRDKYRAESGQAEFVVEGAGPGSSWPGWRVITAPPVPLQDNGSDCGLFVLEYVLGLAQHPERVADLTADLGRPKRGRRRLKYDWFDQETVTHR